MGNLTSVVLVKAKIPALAGKLSLVNSVPSRSLARRPSRSRTGPDSSPVKVLGSIQEDRPILTDHSVEKDQAQCDSATCSVSYSDTMESIVEAGTAVQGGLMSLPSSRQRAGARIGIRCEVESASRDRRSGPRPLHNAYGVGDGGQRPRKNAPAGPASRRAP